MRWNVLELLCLCRIWYKLCKGYMEQLYYNADSGKKCSYFEKQD